MLLDLDNRTEVLRNMSLREHTLDIDIANAGMFDLMRMDIAAEADRIRVIPIHSIKREKVHNAAAGNLSFTELMKLDDMDFVDASYVKLLKRNADLDGARYYLAQLRSGRLSKEELLFKLSNSDEGKHSGVQVSGIVLQQPKLDWFMQFEGEDFVKKVFSWLLGREPDQVGLDQFTRQLRNGMPKEEIYNAIIGSKERGATLRNRGVDDQRNASIDFNELIQFDDAEFIENAYKRILLRDADPKGAAAWLNLCRRGEKNKSDVVFELSTSEEGRLKGVYIHNAVYFGDKIYDLTKLKGTEFIRSMFMWILGRTADETGMRYFKDMMSRGKSKRAILDTILNSQEAMARRQYAQGQPLQGFVSMPVGELNDELMLQMAEASMRDTIVAYQNVDAAEKEHAPEQMEALYRYSALNTFRTFDLKRQMDGLSSTIAAIQQQLEIVKGETMNRIEGVRLELLKTVDEVHRQELKSILELGNEIEKEMQSLRDELRKERQQQELVVDELRQDISDQLTRIDGLRNEILTRDQNVDARISDVRRAITEDMEALRSQVANDYSSVNAQVEEVYRGFEERIEAKANDARQDIDKRLSDMDFAINEKASVVQTEKMTEDMGAMAREIMLAKWKIIDHMRADTEKESDVLTCDICGNAHMRSEYKTMETECIFNGGHLTRYVCPDCGVVFGPTKFTDQGQKGIDEDYWVHYLGFSEGDSEYKEERAFRLLQPTKDKVYLNYGCGKWSKTLQKLRAEGYNVYGYEPYAPETDNPYMITRKEDLMKLRFDGIFSNDVLEHFVNPIEDMAFMKNLLLSEESRMAHCTGCYAYRYEYTRFHTHFFLGDSVKIMAEKAGLDVVGYIDDRRDNDFICYIYAPKTIEVEADYIDWMLRPQKAERIDGVLHIQQGGLICGPYYTLPAGEYTTEIHVDSFASPDAEVAVYKITAEKGARTIAEGKLRTGTNLLRWDSETKVVDFEVVISAESKIKIDKLMVHREQRKGGRSE